MAASGDESESLKNAQHNLTGDAKSTQQTSGQIAHARVSDTLGPQTLQADKTNSTTTAPLSFSSSLPPGLSTRGYGRGRGSRPQLEPIAGESGWRSRPPPPPSNYRGRGRGPPSHPGSSRGGYSGSPTPSSFIAGRRGGRHASSFQPIPLSTAYIHQKPFEKPFETSIEKTIDDDEDAPPPGFFTTSPGSDINTLEDPRPGFITSDGATLDEGPPPGFEEDDAPPPGFENNRVHLARGGGGGRWNGAGRSGGRGVNSQFSGRGSSSEYVASSRGGRGGRAGRGAIAIVDKMVPPSRGVKILEVPRPNRPTSASSSYTNSSSVGATHQQLNYYSNSATAAPPPHAVGRGIGSGGGGGTAAAAAAVPMTTQEGFHPLKPATQPPIFKEFIPSKPYTPFSSSFVDDTSSALRQIAIGGVPQSAASVSGGGVGTMALEQPAAIPPLPNTLQITPLYPQIGIKSIW